MNVTVFQEKLTHYRRDFFDHLGKVSGWNLRVLFFENDQASQPNSAYVMYEPVSRFAAVSGFRFYRALEDPDPTHQMDLLILPFDLRVADIYGWVFRDRKVATCLWGHGRGVNWLSRTIRNFIARRADAIITYSDRRRDEFVRSDRSLVNVFSAPNSLAIPNCGVDASARKSYFLYVGRVQARKRLDLGIRAVSLLLKNGGDVDFRIVGDGQPEIENCRELAASLGIQGHVHFVPATYDHDELRMHFQGAYGYLSPGHVGLGVVHASAYGIPVLTCRDRAHAPEVDHLEEGKSLFLSEFTDEALAATMVEVMRSSSPALALQCYDAFRHGYSLDAMTAGFVQACNFALERREHKQRRI